MIEPAWLSVEQVLRLHAMQVAEFGGAAAIRDYGLLEAAVLRPRQRYHYGELRTLVEVAAAYASALNANHAFIDGNKRVSFHSLLVFLRLHGFTLRVAPDEATHVVLGLAAGQIPELQVREWLRHHVAPAG